MIASIPNIYAVTVNWNKPDDTCECLQSLLDVEGYLITIVVVDNGSTDGSAEIISKRFPQIKLLKQTTNLGFSRGYNAGIRYALSCGADYVFMINNDVWVDRDVLNYLFQYMSSDTGAVCPLIFYASSPDVVWSAGAIANPLTLEVKDKFANHPWAPRIATTFLERDFVTGCGLLLSSKALLGIGLFDEHFYLYYEDMDFCFRLRKAGWRLRVVPGAKMWHKVSRSSGGSGSLIERYWMARSSIRFFRKHATWWQVPFIFFWRSGSALLTTYRLARTKRWLSIKAYWNGLKDGLLEGFQKS